jgi:predicted RNA-binding protein with PUA-like domain
MIDVKFIKKLNKFVPISQIRKNKKLQKIQLLQSGNRLSVMPLTKAEFDELMKMGK